VHKFTQQNLVVLYAHLHAPAFQQFVLDGPDRLTLVLVDDLVQVFSH